MKINHFHEYIKDANPSSKVLEGYEEAIVGIDSFGKLVYSTTILLTLIKSKGLTQESATEWLALCVLSHRETVTFIYSKDI